MTELCCFWVWLTRESGPSKCFNEFFNFGDTGGVEVESIIGFES